MRIDILTLFPGIFAGPFTESIIRRARESGAVEINIIDLRDFTHDRHRVADDYPYGGGVGMVMKPEPIFEALDHLRGESEQAPETILLSPQGEVFRQATAAELARQDWLVLICGHYEGVDERVRQALVTREISIGDYVLTGGEVPAMVVVEAVARLVPGVLGTLASAHQDSFSDGLLEHPHYTRPQVYRGLEVPSVLLSGNHEAIRRWRRKESLRRTAQRRPDLLERAPLSEEDRCLLAELSGEEDESR
ncbi:MAG: tRNA (guanosine(37)-N1)-methyltransferase TrmD [Bacillota bacterium]